MSKPTVIVPARDAAGTLPRLLDALAGENLPRGREVVVVDNGSRDETAEIAKASSVVNRVVRRARGDGPGAARNAGVAASEGELVAFLDADCWPAPGWLAAGIRALDRDDLVQGRVLPDPQVRPHPFDRTLAVGGPHGLFESANLFVRRDLFERLGGFPPGLEEGGELGRGGAPFGEDVIFGWRARRAGARTGFCAEALAYHAVTPRRALEFVSERRRMALFPALAAAVPELREAFFYRHIFFSRRSAAFDLAAAAMLIGLATRQAPVLVGAVPYVGLLTAGARRWGARRAPEAALGELAADAVGAAALIRGSLAARSLLL